MAIGGMEAPPVGNAFYHRREPAASKAPLECRSVHPPGTKNPGLTGPRLGEVFPTGIRAFRLVSKAMAQLAQTTSAAAPAWRCRSRADRYLLARSAGVHVDFHADLHLNDFRSLPSHGGLPLMLAQCSRQDQTYGRLESNASVEHNNVVECG
jgi:hypothetical protein